MTNQPRPVNPTPELSVPGDSRRIARNGTISGFGFFERESSGDRKTWKAGLFHLAGFDSAPPFSNLQSFARWIDPADRLNILRMIRLAVLEGHPGHGEFSCLPGYCDGIQFQLAIEPESSEGRTGKVFWTLLEVARNKDFSRVLEHNLLRLDVTIDNLIESCQIIGFDWRYLYVNEAAARIGNYPKEAYNGNRIESLFPGFEKTELYRILAVSMSRRISQNAEVEFEFPDKRIRWFNFLIQPVPEGLFCLSVDITDRKLKEIEVQAAERRYRNLFENLSEGFVLAKVLFEGDEAVDVQYVDGNEHFFESTGLWPKNTGVKLVSQSLPGIREKDPELFDRLGHVARTGIPDKFEYHVNTLDMWVAMSVYRPEDEHVAVVFEVITDRKQREIELQSSIARLGLAMEAANGGNWQWDLTTNINYWSDELWNIYRLDRKSHTASYDGWMETIRPDDRARVAASVSRSVSRSRPIRVEWQLNTNDGVIRWLLARGKPLRDPDGMVRSYVGVVLDITERKEVEEELKQSRKRYRDLVEMSPDAILVYRNGTIEYGNPAAVRLFGARSAAHLVRENIDRFIQPSLVENVVQHYKVPGNGKMLDLRIARILRFDNQSRTVESNVRLIPDPTDVVIQVVLRDITGRRQLEDEALQWKNLFGHSKLSLAIGDPQTNNLVQVNEAFARHRGFIAEELKGKPVFSVYAEEVHEQLAERLRQIDKTGHGIFESVHVKKDGTKFPVLMDITVMRDEHGKAINRVAYSLDISAQHAIQKREKHMLDLLKICNSATGVHELVGELIPFFREVSGCQAIGVRLKKGSDYPYYQTSGFPATFVATEKFLMPCSTIGEPGSGTTDNRQLECLCGKVLDGQTEHGKSCFTDKGSFFSAGTSELIKTENNATLHTRIRNRCNEAGFETVVLIPVKSHDKVLGLIQFNDRKAGKLNAETVTHLEHLVEQFAFALAKLLAEEEIRNLNLELEKRVSERTRELEEANMRLVQHVDRIEDLYNNAPCGYHSLDKDGLIISINDTELRWLGYSREEIAGKMNFAEILSPESQRDFEINYPEFLRHGEIHDLEFDLLTRDGHIFPVLINATALYDRDGSFLMSRTTLQDFMAVKTARSALMAKAAQLEEVNRELEAFTYSVSHDLKTPLRAIGGFTQILLDEHAGQFNDEMRSLTSTIISNTRRMAQLIDDLLAFSRIGRIEFSREKVDMQKLIDECIDEIDPGKRHVRDIVQVKEALPIISGDRSMLKQVWVNLLSNAIKFSSKVERPRVSVGMRSHRGEIEFYVSDNGAGFDMSFSDRLFKVFQRLHSTRDFEGTGVGLAIVQRVVEKHGGKICADSKPGAGATFRFTLPG